MSIRPAIGGAPRRHLASPQAAAITRGDLLWAGACAAVALLAAAWVSLRLFGGIAHVQDSIAQLFQARIFAGGRLWAPAPPLPEIFDAAHIAIRDGRWYSQYPPGHSLLLVPGVILGVPWLINPVLGGLAILGTYLLALELCGRGIARLAALLGVLSPFLLLMSAEFMSHAGALFAATFFLWSYFRAARSGSARDGITAGLFCALGVLIRPYTALAIAVPCALHGAWRLRREGRRLLRPLLAVSAGGLLGVILLFLYNWGTTGHPLRFGYADVWGSGHGLGFGKGPGGVHDLDNGLRFAADRLRRLNGRLFEWPVSSLWPLALALLLRSRDVSAGSRGWLALFPLSLFAAHFFYWYNDGNDCFGPRYLYEALAPVLILSACGLSDLASWVGRKLSGTNPAGPGRDRLVAALLAVALSGAGAATRWPRLFDARAPRAGAAGDPAPRPRTAFDYFGRGYWGVSPDLGSAVAQTIRGRALILVDTRVAPHPNEHLRRGARYLAYGSAFTHQQPYFDRARVIYAHATPADWTPPASDPEGELWRLMRMNAERFPGRRAYYYRSGMSAPRELPATAGG